MRKPSWEPNSERNAMQMVAVLFHNSYTGLDEIPVCQRNNCSLNLMDLSAESGHLRVWKLRDMVSGTFEGCMWMVCRPYEAYDWQRCHSSVDCLLNDVVIRNYPKCNREGKQAGAKGTSRQFTILNQITVKTRYIRVNSQFISSNTK